MAKARRTGSRGTRRRRTPPGERDYVEIADAFAAEAIADVDGARHCEWVRHAAARYVRDRKRATRARAPFYFDAAIAADACSFIEKLPHVEGTWETPEILLHESHVFFVVNVFGFRNRDGNRRFTTALLAIGRKNAKSLLAAAILLYCLCVEAEPGAQVITAARTGSQARIVFNVAKKIVENTPDLIEAFQLEVYANAILSWQCSGHIKPINAKASTQDGLNPSHVCLDEIHAHPSHDLLNVLKSAAGARSNPLWLYTTTEGYENPGPWPELRHFAHQLLEGVVEADHFFAVIFALDEEKGKPGEPGYRPADADFDESKWIKANPLIEVNPVLRREIEKAAIEAKQMPGTLAEFRIKRLNRRSSVAVGWMNLTKWRACLDEPNLDALARVPCYAGLDLSTTSDLTALRLVWRKDAVIATAGWCWVPRAAVERRKERGIVPYAAWVETGELLVAGDEIVDYDVILEKLIWVRQTFNLRACGFDDWNSAQIQKRATAAGVPMKNFIQGPRSFHPAMKDFEEHYVDGRVLAGGRGSAVLTWCGSNLVARYDANMNTAPDKRKSKEKIDAMTALFMANGLAVAEEVKNREPKLTFLGGRRPPSPPAPSVPPQSA